MATKVGRMMAVDFECYTHGSFFKKIISHVTYYFLKERAMSVTLKIHSQYQY